MTTLAELKRGRSAKGIATVNPVTNDIADQMERLLDDARKNESGTHGRLNIRPERVDNDEPDEMRPVPLSKIQPWPGNPRKHFDQVAIAELSVSIAAKGVLQPILLRRRKLIDRVGKKTQEAEYEIAAGERRWRAAALAGLKVIPAVIRSYSDVDMLEIAVVENEQRQDVSPLEKAEGYGRLMEEHGRSIEQIAEKVGTSESTIRGLLRLRQLPDKAAKALAEGEIVRGVAELIASRPTPQMRDALTKFALEPFRGDELPSYRDVKEQIRYHHMIELKQAPFTPEEATLTGAGACTTCPKRAGNNPELYGEARADVCMDPACFREKVKAWSDRAEQRAKDAGHQVLSKKQAKEVYPYSYNSSPSHSSGYADLADQCYDDKKRRTHEQIVAKQLDPADVVLCRDQKGDLHRLIKKNRLASLLKAAGIKKPQHASRIPQEKPEVVAQRKREAAIKELAEKKIIEHVVRDMTLEADVEFKHGMKLPRKMVVILSLMIEDLLSRQYGDELRDVLISRGIEPPKNYGEQAEKVGELIDDLPVAGLWVLAAELLVREHVGGFGGDLKDEVQRDLGIDVAHFRALAAKELNNTELKKVIGNVKHKPGCPLADDQGEQPDDEEE